MKPAIHIFIFILNDVPDPNVTQGMSKQSCHIGESLLKYFRPGVA